MSLNGWPYDRVLGVLAVGLMCSFVLKTAADEKSSSLVTDFSGIKLRVDRYLWMRPESLIVSVIMAVLGGGGGGVNLA